MSLVSQRSPIRLFIYFFPLGCELRKASEKHRVRVTQAALSINRHVLHRAKQRLRRGLCGTGDDRTLSLRKVRKHHACRLRVPAECECLPFKAESFSNFHASLNRIWSRFVSPPLRTCAGGGGGGAPQMPAKRLSVRGAPLNTAGVPLQTSVRQATGF